jgi:hypothetical protein
MVNGLRAALLAIGVMGLMGCSTDEAEQACLDVADALATSAERCGFDYDANFDAFVDAAASGDCGNIVSVRDKTSLYDDCVPHLEDLTCAELNDSSLSLPPSCESQLLR